MIFFVQFGINKRLWTFQRPQKAQTLRARALLLVFEKFSRAYLLQIAREKSRDYLNLQRAHLVIESLFHFRKTSSDF